MTHRRLGTSTRARYAAILALATLVAVPSGAAEEEKKGPVFSGLFDLYYLYQTHVGSKHYLLAPGHAYYDTRPNTATLALAELNVTQTAPENGLGYKLTLIAGDAADLNHAAYANAERNDLTGASTREGRLKNVQQAFLSYNASGYVIDGGKFYTPFGYEITEANGNWNYSHGVLYNFVPVYHAGFRVATPFFSGLTASGYVVQAMFNTANAGVNDDNNDKGLIGQLAYAQGPLSAIFNAGYSKDKLNLVDSQGILLTDLVLTYKPEGPNQFAAEALYRNDDASGAAPGSDIWGVAAYYLRLLDDRNSVAARVSWADQTVDSDEGSTSTNPWDVTLTYAWQATSRVTLKGEYRHGGSNQPIYTGSDGSVSEESEDAFVLAALYAF